MCFIKTSKQIPYPIFQPCGNNCQLPISPLEPFHFPLLQYPPPFLWNYSSIQNQSEITQNIHSLKTIINQVQINNQSIHVSFKQLQENQRQLRAIKNQIVQISKQFLFSKEHTETYQQTSNEVLNAFFSTSPIINKIFGVKEYRYRIKSTCDFSKTIYKQRNINLSLHLTSKQGILIKNSNLIHLCIAVCDQNGKWIIGQDDDYFIKGKVESNLYRGECQFKKIYPTDISRQFPGRKVNIIIYPKPSILITTAPLLKGQQIVDCSKIEPLIFSNVVIKAKKTISY